MWHELAHNWAHWSNVPNGLAETLSPSHVIGETFCEIGTFVAGVLVARPWRRLRKHDEKHTAEIASIVDARLKELHLLSDAPPLKSAKIGGWEDWTPGMAQEAAKFDSGPWIR